VYDKVESVGLCAVLFPRAAGGGRRVFERIGVEEIVDRGFFGYAETETMVLV
jgi:hypothetical protein